MLALGEARLPRPSGGIRHSRHSSATAWMSIDVFLGVKEGVERARRGEGPTYVIAHTYRFLGHHVGDPLTYRDKEEPTLWRALDPIPNYGQLLRSRVWPHPRSRAWSEEAVAAVSGGRGLCRGEPGSRPRHRDGRSVLMSGQRSLTYAQALNEALREEMRRDRRVMLMGEDIAVWGGGGVFGVTRGLSKSSARSGCGTRLSPRRVHRVGLGAALAGLRPVVEYMYVDFAMLAMDQICNQAAKIRWMLGGRRGRAPGHPHPAGRGQGQRAPAFAEPRGVVRPHPGPDRGPAQHPLRRQGVAQDRHPQQRSRGVPRAQAAVRRERTRAPRPTTPCPSGRRRCFARAARHLRRRVAHGPEGSGSGGYSRLRGHRAGGDRPPDPGPLRPTRRWPGRSSRPAGCW